MFVLANPACAGGGFSQLPPLVRIYWYERVLEGLPVWQFAETLSPSLVGYLFVPTVALAGLALLERKWTWWTAERLEYAALLCGTLLVGLLVFRATVLCAALAQAGFALALYRTFQAALERKGARKAGFLALLILLLSPWIPMAMLQAAAARQTTASPVMQCDWQPAIARLKGLPPATVFAPLDPAPAILRDTGHSVIATAHHRGAAGMEQVIRAFMAPPETARRIVEKKGARYLTACIDANEMRSYAADAPDGLAAQLAAGAPPDWLTPLAASDNGATVLYRVADR